MAQSVGLIAGAFAGDVVINAVVDAPLGDFALVAPASRRGLSIGDITLVATGTTVVPVIASAQPDYGGGGGRRRVWRERIPHPRRIARVAAQLPSITAAASASVSVSAAAAIDPLADLTLVAAAAALNSAAVAATMSPPTLASAGSARLCTKLEAQLSAITADAAAVARTSAAARIDIPPLSLISGSGAALTARLAAAVPALTLTASGERLMLSAEEEELIVMLLAA
jgi:hypothetical protein